METLLHLSTLALGLILFAPAFVSVLKQRKRR